MTFCVTLDKKPITSVGQFPNYKMVRIHSALLIICYCARKEKEFKNKNKTVAEFLLEIQIPLVGNYLDANLGLKGEFLRSLEYGENR